MRLTTDFRMARLKEDAADPASESAHPVDERHLIANSLPILVIRYRGFHPRI